MTAMTFESIATSPRRAAARRVHRPAVQLVAVEKPHAAIAGVSIDGAVAGYAGKRGFKPGLFFLTAATIVLHAAIIMAIQKHDQNQFNATPKIPPLTIDIAPPVQAPPPVIQPKPLPQVAKPITASKPVTPPAPSLPVVSNVTPSDAAAATADTVQVATTPAPVAAPVIERVTEPVGYAGYLRNPTPDYPAIAQKRGMEGQVVLKVHVLSNGHPDDISVAKSSGYGILDSAAIKAVTAWAFQPARRGQTAIDGWVQIPLSFKL